MAKRIQFSRKKGSKLPPNTVNVARPGKFGNPFNWTDCDPSLSDAERKRLAALDYENWLTKPKWSEYIPESNRQWILDNLHLINDADFVACWCKLDEPCHADVLIRLANKSLLPNC